MELNYSVSFIPEWPDIELFRRSVNAILEAVLRDADLIEAIAMTSSELLENGVKHGAGKEVRYDLSVVDNCARVRMVNHYRTDNNIDRLMERISWIDRFDNPLDAFIARMQHLYNDESASGLGLVRITYEGRCSLKCQLDQETRTVEVSGEFQQLPWHPTRPAPDDD